MVATSPLHATGGEHDVTVSVAIGTQSKINHVNTKHIYTSPELHTARVVVKVPIPVPCHAGSTTTDTTAPAGQHQGPGCTRAAETLFTQHAREFIDHARTILRQLEQHDHDKRMALSSRDHDPGTAIAVAYAVCTSLPLFMVPSLPPSARDVPHVLVPHILLPHCADRTT
eukprot:TRINITY_DN3674_c0_g1_i16.p1 TRINITY_DN3674_c0_g1~~TRINITY_DN3674_c0_g1_i16.p1  ORF type:complete len:170 (+),score=4.75 TRINITY_DN3674_c0_g1_i16:68-577(+)